MPDELLLPIRVVFPRQADFRRPEETPRDWDPFEPVTSELRSKLAGQVEVVAAEFATAFEEWSDAPAVARVTLKPRAVAKTYRPTELFNEDTCPIIGCNRLGELYVSVQPRGLERLAERLQRREAKRTVAHISTLDRIEPYSPPDVTAVDVVERLAPTTPLRFRMFRHRSARLNEALDLAFAEIQRRNGIRQAEPLHYAEGLRVFALRNVDPAAIRPLSSFIGTQSLGPFPSYRVVRTASRVLGNITADAFPPPEPGVEYAVVGIIDTGTDASNPHLQAWVAARHEWVPPALQNNAHGSFVAGLLIHGRRLNHGDVRFPSGCCKIIDVVALDRDGVLDEPDLLHIIDDSLSRFPDVRVWNLSLGVRTIPVWTTGSLCLGQHWTSARGEG